MIVLKLGAVHQVADDARIFGNLNANRHFDCPHRGQGVDVRSDPAGTAHEQVGIAGVTPLKNHFNAAKHLPGAPGIDNFAARDFHLDAQVAFDARNGINYNSLAHIDSFPS
jgi:hypothetical protein